MLNVITIIDCNWAIGYRGRLLCHLPADLKRFKDITMGHPLIMGRKTFESLPQILPGRHHYVATRNPDFRVNDNRVTIVKDLEAFLAKGDEEYFVIGGGDIYRIALPYADKLYLTILADEFEADTYFPQMSDNYLTEYWRKVEDFNGVCDDENRYRHRFVVYERKRGSAKQDK